MHPIGVIHSPFTDKTQTPIQSSRSQEVGLVEIYPEFVEGLRDVEGFSHLIVLYWMHKVASSEVPLKVRPMGRKDVSPVGLFASRAPHRPNRIGKAVVRLLQRRGNILTVKGLDAEGRKVRIKADGLLARVFQHEIDHCEGVLFIDHIDDPEKLWPVEEGEEEAAEATQQVPGGGAAEPGPMV